MRANAGVFIIVCLVFLIGTVGAEVGIPDTLKVNTNTAWLVANGTSQSTITVTVTNITSGAVPGATVNLAVNDTIFGTLSAITVTTDSTGKASSTFTTKKKSGAATITATLPGYPAVPSDSVIQNIDHDIPYYDPSFRPPLFEYPAQGEVAKEVDLRISMHDQWGNDIDNRTGTNHMVTLYVNGPDPDDCGFNTGSGYAHIYSPTLNADGNLTVKVRLTSKIGINYIHMGEIKPGIVYQTISINAVGSGVPVSLGSVISNGGILPANNIDEFSIDYHLYDVYGNPMANKSIWISTNITGEETPALYTADPDGLIRFYYGPKVEVVTANITAVSADNASVKNVTIAQFVANVATNMVLTVTPGVMASRDMNPASSALVRATVIDEHGNPVSGEVVTFSLGAITPEGIMTIQPSLVSATAVTDVDGNAIVEFVPGSFPKFGKPNFNMAATGTAVITATWNGFSRPVTVTWKNYPYIDIKTSADPSINVPLNGTVDVSIDVTGNGYHMYGGNVAAMLDLDSSSSMWSNPDVPPAGYPCADPGKCIRMDSAKGASNAFSEALLTPPPTENWIGVDSFGYNKKVNPLLLSPQNDITLVQYKIANVIPGTTSQGMLDSIRDCINNLSETQATRTPQDKVRAVVILKDTADGGTSSVDPTSTINLAKSTTPPTMIFPVYYNDGSTNTAAMQLYLENIANETEGQFFMARNSEELVAAFKYIAKILKARAGVNATMVLDLKNVEVDSAPMDGTVVFDYVPVGTPYVLSTDAKTREEVTGRTRIMWQNATHSVKDQSGEWTASQQLHFAIGTVNLSDRWNTTYRLKVKKTGLINIFNCSISQSRLSFNDGTQTLDQEVCLPDLFINVNPAPNTGLGGDLELSDLTPQSGTFTGSVLLQWKLKYQAQGTDTATETYYYAYNPANLPEDDSHLIYVEFGSVSGIPSTNGEFITRSTTLNLNGFYQGPYAIKVVASVPGAPWDTEYGRFTIPYDSESGKINIQLK